METVIYLHIPLFEIGPYIMIHSSCILYILNDIKKKCEKNLVLLIMHSIHTIKLHNLFKHLASTSADPEVVTGGLDPLKNHKNIEFLSNTGPDPLKNYKATKQAFNVRPSFVCQQSAI